MSKSKTIKISCKISDSIAINELETFQGELKTITDAELEKLKQSIIKYGFSFPIFIWQKKILDGHQRLKAVKKLITEGYKLPEDNIPVVRIKAENKRQAAEKLLLISSRYAEINQGGFQTFIYNQNIDLSQLIPLIELPEIDLSFDNNNFEGLTDPDNVPDVPKETVTKPGDIWLLGDHRLMCGDSTKIEDVNRLMNGKRSELCFTSPPYNLNEKIINKKQKNRSRKVYLNYKDIPKDFNELFKISYQFCDYFAVNIQMNANNRVQFIKYLSDINDKLIDIMVWYKHTTAPNFHKSILSRGYEFIIIYGLKSADTVHIPFSNWHGTVNNIIDLDARRWAEYRNINKATMPVKLPIYIFNKVFNLSKLIYEPFTGCGTTMIAAEKTGRCCYAMEIDPHYVDIAVKRWEDFTGIKAILEDVKNTNNL